MKYLIRKLILKDLSDFLLLFNRILKEDFPEYQPKVSLIYRKYVFNKEFFKDFIKNKNNIIFGAFEKEKIISFL